MLVMSICKQCRIQAKQRLDSWTHSEWGKPTEWVWDNMKTVHCPAVARVKDGHAVCDSNIRVSNEPPLQCYYRVEQLMEAERHNPHTIRPSEISQGDNRP